MLRTEWSNPGADAENYPVRFLETATDKLLGPVARSLWG